MNVRTRIFTRGFFAVVVAVIACFVGIIYWQQREKKSLKVGEYTIVRTSYGFVPSLLTIPQGASVRFLGTSGEDFWPASDVHPTHEEYPLFDSQKPTPATGSYVFQFDEPGSWGYHDHMASQYMGTITVVGGIGSSIASYFGCLFPSRLPRIQKKNCWDKEVIQVLTRQGLAASFQKIASLYRANRDFGSYCHDITHVLGRSAYRQVQQGKHLRITSEASTCGYGFFHGFMEAMLSATGNYDGATDLCTTMEDSFSANIAGPLAVNNCYHGMGHAVFDNQNMRVWGNAQIMVDHALAFCRRVIKVENNEYFIRCGAGVYNSLANAYSSRTYKLAMPKIDQFDVCNDQKDVRLRTLCYKEIGVAYTTVWKLDPDKARDFIQSVTTPDDAMSLADAYMSEIVKDKMDETYFRAHEQYCHSFQPYLVTACIQGAVKGFLGWGKPKNEYVPALLFCGQLQLTNGEKEACFDQIGKLLMGIYGKKKSGDICKRLPEHSQSYCKSST